MLNQGILIGIGVFCFCLGLYLATKYPEKVYWWYFGRL
jgi:hypothetical protein